MASETSPQKTLCTRCSTFFPGLFKRATTKKSMHLFSLPDLKSTAQGGCPSCTTILNGLEQHVLSASMHPDLELQSYVIQPNDGSDVSRVCRCFHFGVRVTSFVLFWGERYPGKRRRVEFCLSRVGENSRRPCLLDPVKLDSGIASAW